MSSFVQEYAPYLLIAVFVVGGWIGFFTACLMAVSREGDEIQGEQKQ